MATSLFSEQWDEKESKWMDELTIGRNKKLVPEIHFIMCTLNIASAISECSEDS